MSNKSSELLTKLQNSDPDVRETALDEIGTLKPNNALELIVPFLSDENTYVRQTAACNLGEIQDERAICYLIQTACQDTDEMVSYYALNALGAYKSPYILDYLVAEVYRGDLSTMAKQTVAKQLSNYDTHKAIDALVTLLQQNNDPYILVPTVDSLLKLNRPCLQDTWLNILLHYDHSHLGKVALQALADLEQVEPLDVALSFTKSHDSAVRRGAAHGLASLDDERVIPHLIELASKDIAIGVRDMAILGLTEYTDKKIDNMFINAIEHQNLSPFARELIAEELSFYNSSASINALTGLLQDENEIVRTTARYSLDHINGKSL